MLSTLLLLLKILIIVFLVILALTVLILLLVLCVPIRYKVGASYEDQLNAEARITWFLHLLSVPITYDKSLKASVKVLGFPVFRIGREDGRKKESFDDLEEILWEDDKEEESEGKVSDGFEKETGENQAEAFEKGRGQEEEEDPLPPKDSECFETKKEKEKKSGFSFQSLCHKAGKAKELYEKAGDFLADPANRNVFRKILRMVKHILPKKVSGDITFGFGDPFMTGKVLALLGFASSWSGDSIHITPVFEEKIIEGTIAVKGRIFLGALLCWCLTILLNKNIRRLIFRRGRRKDGGREDGRN